MGSMVGTRLSVVKEGSSNGCVCGPRSMDNHTHSVDDGYGHFELSLLPLEERKYTCALESGSCTLRTDSVSSRKMVFRMLSTWSVSTWSSNVAIDDRRDVNDNATLCSFLRSLFRSGVSMDFFLFLPDETTVWKVPSLWNMVRYPVVGRGDRRDSRDKVDRPATQRDGAMVWDFGAMVGGVEISSVAILYARRT